MTTYGFTPRLSILTHSKGLYTLSKALLRSMARILSFFFLFLYTHISCLRIKIACEHELFESQYFSISFDTPLIPTALPFGSDRITHLSSLLLSLYSRNGVVSFSKCLSILFLFHIHLDWMHAFP